MNKKMLVTALAGFAVAGAVLAAPASAAPKTDPGAVGPTHAPCNTAGPNRENRVQPDAPAGGAANQRSGSSTTCTAVGVLQPTDDALYFCFTVGLDNFTWTYLQNQRTGVRGWVRDDLLDLNPNGTRGSVFFCGF